MNIRYYVDADTDLPHIYGHGVHESEVEDVLARPMENLPGRRNARNVIGRTRSGRVLKVICVPDDEGDGIFVATAYDLHGNPLRAFKRRLRRRGLR
jgi:hypothetical protein